MPMMRLALLSATSFWDAGASLLQPETRDALERTRKRPEATERTALAQNACAPCCIWEPWKSALILISFAILTCGVTWIGARLSHEGMPHGESSIAYAIWSAGAALILAGAWNGTSGTSTHSLTLNGNVCEIYRACQMRTFAYDSPGGAHADLPFCDVSRETSVWPSMVIAAASEKDVLGMIFAWGAKPTAVWVAKLGGIYRSFATDSCGLCASPEIGFCGLQPAFGLRAAHVTGFLDRCAAHATGFCGLCAARAGVQIGDHDGVDWTGFAMHGASPRGPPLPNHQPMR